SVWYGRSDWGRSRNCALPRRAGHSGQRPVLAHGAAAHVARRLRGAELWTREAAQPAGRRGAAAAGRLGVFRRGGGAASQESARQNAADGENECGSTARVQFHHAPVALWNRGGAARLGPGANPILSAYRDPAG